jgi:hypothetical protein
MWKVTSLHIKNEELLLSTASFKSYSSQRQMWTVTYFYEEWLLSSSNVKSDSSPHEMWRVTRHNIKRKQWFLCILMWRVIPLYIVCEVWLVSTSNFKSDSTSYVKSYSNVKSDSSLHKIWIMTPLYIKCEEWLLFNSNMKSDSSPHQCEEKLLFLSNVKRDSARKNMLTSCQAASLT